MNLNCLQFNINKSSTNISKHSFLKINTLIILFVKKIRWKIIIRNHKNIVPSTTQLSQISNKCFEAFCEWNSGFDISNEWKLVNSGYINRWTSTMHDEKSDKSRIRPTYTLHYRTCSLTYLRRWLYLPLEVGRGIGEEPLLRPRVYRTLRRLEDQPFQA